MLEATETEWNRVFKNEHRLIKSIYNEHDEHIGECFIVLDGEGNAELSLLIGKKELWHRGYGTATISYLIDNTLANLDFNSVWVRVPRENTAALGLFEKFGFVTESNRAMCQDRKNSQHHSSVLALDMNLYRSRQLSGNIKSPTPVVTVTGLSGSGSEEVAAAVAKLLGRRVADSEIKERVLKRLRCSEGELELFKQSFGSRWGRFMQAFALPVTWPGSYEAGNHWPASEVYYQDPGFDKKLSKKQYIEALQGVIKQISIEGDSVLHGSGISQFVPTKVPSISVFVSASHNLRARTIRKTNNSEVPHESTTAEIKDTLERLDRDEKVLCQNMVETDLMDMTQYDLIVNLDKISVNTAARSIVSTILMTETPSVPKNVPITSTIKS
jgi:cytidylate kinase